MKRAREPSPSFKVKRVRDISKDLWAQRLFITHMHLLITPAHKGGEVDDVAAAVVVVVRLVAYTCRAPTVTQKAYPANNAFGFTGNINSPHQHRGAATVSTSSTPQGRLGPFAGV